MSSLPNTFEEISEETFLQRYTLFEHLGSGGYTNVVRAVEKTGKHREVALKMTKQFQPMAPECARKELEMLCAVGESAGEHGVVKLLDAFYFVTESLKHCFVLVFPRHHSNLFEYLHRHNPPPSSKGLCEQEIFNFAFQIKTSLSYLHSKNLLHGDLKLKNFVLTKPTNPNDTKATNPNDTQPTHDICLLDFGLARRFADCGKGLVSTTHYRAPEALCRRLTWTPAVDMWAYGVMLLEMVTGQNVFRPYNTNKGKSFAFMEHFTESEFPDEILQAGPGFAEFRDEVSRKPTLRNLVKNESLCDLLKGLLDLNPESRLTMSEVCEHPYFESEF